MSLRVPRSMINSCLACFIYTLSRSFSLYYLASAQGVPFSSPPKYKCQTHRQEFNQVI